MKIVKILLVFVLAISAAFSAYKWDKKRKLDNYFIEQFALDRQTQLLKNDSGHGEIFEKALKQIQEENYNPQEIYDIMVKGFDKGNTLIQNTQDTDSLG